MKTARCRPMAAGLCLVVLGVSTARARTGWQPTQTPEPQARPELVRQPYSPADVDFMAGMIPHAIQGNYNGFQIFDLSNPEKPVLALTYVCPESQSDVSVYKNLLFVSGEGQAGRTDCGIQGVPEPVSKDRLRGIRIFDIANMASPQYVANVQTCRGSHTHTVVTDSQDKDNVYIKSYYKMPAPQTSLENCVAHNGSLIPIPGREVMVQGWYQGGISVFDWTDAAKPREIAFFDRGPVDSTRLILGGSWSVYWYNGLIVSSEIARGLDIFELLPSGLVSQNEIDAAKTVRFDYLNAQQQRKIVWPPSFAKAWAYLDQLERGSGLAAARVSAARDALASAEKLSGQPRQQALKRLASQVNSDASRAADRAKTRLLSGAVRELANVP